MTTNWDFLLQKEVDKLAQEFVPACLYPETRVFHINGTIQDSENRSAIVLREDRQREPSQELNQTIAYMAWGRMFVVVGMSFECQPDRALFKILSSVRDELPVGESDWIIVNPCAADRDNARNLVNGTLPGASIILVPDTLTGWREAQFPQLRQMGVFRD